MKFKNWAVAFAATLFTMLAPSSRIAAQDNTAQNNTAQNHKSKHHKYRLVDLGTFGGPTSNLSGPEQGVLNNLGTFAAVATTSAANPNPGCFNQFGAPNCFVTHGGRWRNGVFTDLGTLPGGNNSNTTWISESGLIAGDSENGLVDPLTGLVEANAVLWAGGKIINLGTVPGGTQSLATTVNGWGQIAGFSNNGISDPFSLGGFSTQTRAFRWQQGTMLDLGTLGGPDALAAFINERGQIAGLTYSNSTPNTATGIPTLVPFLWEDGTMLDLGSLGGTIGVPNGLNSRGQVAGNSDLAGDLAHHPFLWSQGRLKDLGTLGGDNGETFWINEAGDVAGWAALPIPCSGCDAPGNQVYHGVLWSDGRKTDLGTVPGDKCSIAFAMNDGDQVVGASGICHGGLHAFLWENGGPMVDVNTLVFPKSDINAVYPFDINDRGEIAAQGFLPNGDVHAVLLIPDGDCDRDCEDRIATNQNNIASVRYPPAMRHVSEPGISQGDQFRNWLRRRYHISGRADALLN